MPPRLAFALLFLLACAGSAIGAGAPPVPAAPPGVGGPAPSKPPPNPLVWDSIRKVHRAEPGQVTADFTFMVHNSGSAAVTIERIDPSCGCTLVLMPEDPWVLAPGGAGAFTARLDFAGLRGVVAKHLEVVTSAGRQTLLVSVEIPETDPAVRLRNQEIARKDRQLVFQNDCATCHVAPLAGKTGAELYSSACGICHQAPVRAPMVPDLNIAREPRDAAYWRRWIRDGKEGTLMPAFAADHGGPLSDAQIDALVEYLLGALPTQPKVIPKLEERPLPKLPLRKRAGEQTR